MQIALLTLNRIVFKKHIKKEEKKRNKTKPTAFPPRRKRHRPDEWKKKPKKNKQKTSDLRAKTRWRRRWWTRRKRKRTFILNVLLYRVFFTELTCRDALAAASFVPVTGSRGSGSLRRSIVFVVCFFFFFFLFGRLRWTVSWNVPSSISSAFTGFYWVLLGFT